MMKITPENIIKRHKEFPGATEKLIKSYAFQAYKDAVKDLLNRAEIMNPINNVVLVAIDQQDFKEWKEFDFSFWRMEEKNEEGK